MTRLNEAGTRGVGMRAVVIACSGAAWIGAAASGDIFDFMITLDGGQQNPPVDTPATGSGTAMLDTETNELSWNITYEEDKLTSPAIAAHFHGPADLCENAGVLIGLEVGSPIVGSAVVTDEQEQQILEGLWYVNVHTEMFSGGEIRGQVEHAPIDDPIPAPIEFGDITVRLEPITVGLTAPNYGTSAPGVADRLFVVDQTGQVWNVNLDTFNRSVFLDVSDRIVDLGAFGKGTFDERGLLGLAFHPDYQSNGLLYTYTSEPFSKNTPADFSTMPPDVEPDHQSVIAEWEVFDPSDANTVVDPTSRRELMRIDQPQFNHDAGTVAFGPDGMLYVALGDGGSGDDQSVGHVCIGNGQDFENILGSVVRIDPQGDNSGNGQYGIPADNPFVNKDGLDEIYAYGFRNPFRMSFDTATGELWLADAGQNDIEWVHQVVAGGNHGWRVKEGSFAFIANGHQRGYATTPQFLNRPEMIDPVAEYDHDEGIVVIGGFVSRGDSVPSLEGRYVFGEHLPNADQNKIGRLFYLDENDTIQEMQLTGYEAPFRFLLGFGTDTDGEIYVMGNEVQVPFENTGVVLRIAPEFNLTLEGECPGSTGVAVQGATPNGRVAIVAARGEGDFVIPGGVCEGTELGLDDTVRVVAMTRADSQGVALLNVNAPPQACGSAFVQAIDVETCATTDVEDL